MLEVSDLEVGDKFWHPDTGCREVHLVDGTHVSDTRDFYWFAGPDAGWSEWDLHNCFRIPTKTEHVKVGDTLRVVKENDIRDSDVPGPIGSEFVVKRVMGSSVVAMDDSGEVVHMSVGDYLSCCIVIPGEVETVKGESPAGEPVEASPTSVEDVLRAAMQEAYELGLKHSDELMDLSVKFYSQLDEVRS